MRRLIDAEAYKEAMKAVFPEYYEDVLDDQPTIDAEPCSVRSLDKADGYTIW